MQEMTTEALLALLKDAYPDKSWRLCAFDVNGHDTNSQTRKVTAIVFTESAISIHDPMSSLCGRGEQPDRYGMTEEHARLLRRHNRTYEKIYLERTQDLGHVFEQLAHAINTQPDLDPVMLLDDYGFTPWHSGGGCMAYALFNPDDSHVLVTDEDGSSLPKRFGEAMVGLYDTEGNEVKLFQRQTVRLFGETAECAVNALTEVLQVHYLEHASASLSEQAKQHVAQHGKQLALFWLHHSLPDGSKVKTEDGYTFVRTDGKWTDNELTFATLADIPSDFVVLDAN